MNALNHKNDIRRKIKNLLASLESDRHREWSQQLSHNLLLFLKQQSQLKKIGVFSPIQAEPLWFLDEGLKEYEYALPSITDQLMQFHIADWETLIAGSWGAGFNVETVQVRDIDLLLVPGLAFDKKFNRMGRGAGYYDRYLESNRPKIVIGLCFEMQLLDLIPTEGHDQSVDYLITEKKVYKGAK